jgi:hypothetical protein
MLSAMTTGGRAGVASFVCADDGPHGHVTRLGEGQLVLPCAFASPMQQSFRLPILETLPSAIVRLLRSQGVITEHASK